MKPSHKQSSSVLSPQPAEDPQEASGDTERAEPRAEGDRILELTLEELPHWEDLGWC